LIASNLNADIKSISLNADFSYNVDEILKEVDTQGSLTVISNPNNPTGTGLEYDDIVKIVKASKGIVVIDEAYIHFGGKTALDLINKYNNLLILRTFSKAFGLAGLRIGMMFGHRDLILQMSKVKLPYNLNIFTLIALDEIFNDISYIDEHIRIILSEREYVEKNLKSFSDIEIIPTMTNFFLVRVKDSKWLFNELLKYGVLVRDVSSYPMLKDCLRISVGSENDNKILADSLRQIYKEV
jgi:histidinol-phosphate aminotransferase